MSGISTEMKGRANEAIGDLTDDERRRRDGKTGKATGTINEKLEDTEDSVADKVDDLRDKVTKA